MHWIKKILKRLHIVNFSNFWLETVLIQWSETVIHVGKVLLWDFGNILESVSDGANLQAFSRYIPAFILIIFFNWDSLHARLNSHCMELQEKETQKD